MREMMGKNKGRLNARVLAILLSVLMLLSSSGVLTLAEAVLDTVEADGELTLSTDAVKDAAEGEQAPLIDDGTGLCEHHPAHTADCGYIEAQGHPCEHELYGLHDAECGYYPGSEEIPCDKDCNGLDEEGNLVHFLDCAYQPAIPPSPCMHEHNRACGFEPASPCIHRHDDFCGYSEAADCTHMHDEFCGYVETVEASPCQHQHDETCGYIEAVDCIHEHDEFCGFVEAVDGTPCVHQHDEFCGYAEPVEAQPCQHQHDEFCGYSDGTEEIPCDLFCEDWDEDGIIDHEFDCAYTPAQPATPCNHYHDEFCGYIEPVDGQPCQHAHDEFCGYIAAVEGVPCAHVHDELCGYVEGNPCGHTEHDETCSYAEYVEGSDCIHIHDEFCGYAEDAPCEHAHDASCGYLDPILEQPCQFVCEVCSLIMADWSWVDNWQILTTGTDYGLEEGLWVMDLPDLEEDDIAALLPASIAATTKIDTEVELPVIWDLENRVKFEMPAAEEPTEAPAEDEYAIDAMMLDGEELALIADVAGDEDELPADEGEEPVEDEKIVTYYLYSADLPEEYTLDDGVPELQLIVREDMYASWAHTIVSWEWDDPYEILLRGEDYGVEGIEWVLGVPMELTVEQLESLLPEAIIATMKNGDVETVPITWDFAHRRFMFVEEIWPDYFNDEESGGSEFAPSLDDDTTPTSDQTEVGADAYIEIDEPDVPLTGDFDAPADDSVLGATTYGAGEDSYGVSQPDSYYLVPAQLPEGYVLDDDSSPLQVLVQMAPINPLFVGTELTPEDLPGALHFIVRNWHTKETSGTFGNPAPSGSWYFVVAEGYIAPNDPEDLDQGYEIYMVFRDDVEFTEGQYEGKTFEAGTLAKLTSAGDSDYIFEYDKTRGSITLKPCPLRNENFLGYSITAGAGTGAITNNGKMITITYDSDVHLVKAHAFYKDIESNGLAGVDGDEEEGFFKDDEHDTAMADYVEANDSYNQNDEGDIKVYNTAEGLHTDKTATEHIGTIPDVDEDGNQKNDPETGELLTKEGHDGRTFDIQLDAWHSKGFAPWVGMVLDASGSMAFASDVPTPINVNGLDQSVIDQLANKIGFVNNYGYFEQEVEVPFPEYDKLLGYYEILQRGFLTDNPGNYRSWFLNSKKQDPSKFTGENDFKSADRNNFAKVVPQADKSGEFDFSEEKQLTVLQYSDYKREDRVAKVWGDVPIKFDNINGIGLDNIVNGEAFFPESQPKGQDFTLAFSLNGTKSMGGRSIVEIAYVGGLTGNRDTQDHFYLFRQNNDLIGVMGGYDESAKTLFKISKACNGQHNFVFVFEGNDLYVYMDGALQRKADVTGLPDDRYVVFKPFGKVDEGVNPSTFWLDSIYLFEESLTSSDIDILNQVAGDPLTEKVTVMMGAFLTANELNLLMDPNFTDHSAKGTAGYTYFVFDPRNGTSEYVSLGYYKNGSTAEKVLKYNNTVTSNGWYYCSYGNWDSYSSTDKITAKTLYGLAKGNYYDTIRPRKTDVGKDTGVGAAPDLTSLEGNTDKLYEVSSAGGPVKFYIDAEGYLRCFLGISDKPYASFVYKLEDSEYVKTETLERAVGAFVTELNEKAPYAKISAVRFSAEAAGPDDLLMLNWTSEAQDSIGFFTGSTGGNIVSNYDLTGGTFTATGVKAYLERLENNKTMQDEAEPGAPKYLIIFTDGADNDIGKVNPMPAEAPVTELKEKGYTIFTVMLNGGTVKAGSSTYESAKEYLVGLSGAKDTPDDEKKNYFFSSDEARSQLASEGVNVSNMRDSDVLTTIFSNKILNMITDPLEDYIVQDYIDPRFDLVDKDGVVWHLNADGQVVAGNETYYLKNGDKPHILFTNETGIMGSEGSSDDDSDDTGDDSGAAAIAEDDGGSSSSGSGLIKGSPNPYLYYESSKDLYYLRWEGQDIPGCSVGSNLTSIWSRTITVRAKEDFLGGNAVLCDGIDEYQNYVFESSLDGEFDKISSGSDMAVPRVDSDPDDPDIEDPDDPDVEVYYDHLSKGFPRVSVNVKPPEEDVELVQAIYMGETLNAKKIASMLIQAGKENADTEAVYYWEYVTRFVNYFNWLIDEGDLKKNDPEQYLILKGVKAGDPVVLDKPEDYSVIKTLHIMNRSGNYIPSDDPDSLVDGSIKIISNRILGMMQSDDPQKKLSVENLSELLVDPSTIMGDKGDHDSTVGNKENYLYIPYIYLPDSPTGQTNSTGTDAHERDVIGYLYFHVTEQYLEKGQTISAYPKFPEDGITKDTITRKSGLTVSFEVRGKDRRAEWNNGQMIQEKKTVQEENADGEIVEVEKPVYGRDTKYRPAPGTETLEENRIVIDGSFTTFIYSGQIQLQVKLTDAQYEELKGTALECVVELMRKVEKGEAEEGEAETGGDEFVVVGTFRIDKDTTAVHVQKDNDKCWLYTASFTPNESYMGYKGEDAYGLPYGTYKLNVVKDFKVPVGYKVKNSKAIDLDADKYDRYTETDLYEKGYREPNPKKPGGGGSAGSEPTEPEPTEPDPDVSAGIALDNDEFGDTEEPGTSDGSGTTGGTETTGGTGNPSGIIARLNGQSFVLGNGLEDAGGRNYTDYRLGLYQSELLEIGNLKISKEVKKAESCTKDTANDFFTFTVYLYKDASYKEPYDMSDIGDTYKTVMSDGSVGPDVKFTKGVSAITLKAGKSIIIKDLPADTCYYKVVESATAGYVNISDPLEPTGQLKKKTADDVGQDTEMQEAKFTNMPLHTLTIEKEVVGGKGEDLEKLWEFTVELKNGIGELLDGEYDYEILPGGVSGKILKGSNRFYLKHGQKIVIKGLSCGIGYTVKEIDANFDAGDGKRYVTTVAGEKTDTYSGTLLDDSTVSYVNSKINTKVTITKTVVSSVPADNDKEFEFTVTVVLPAGEQPPEDGYAYNISGDSELKRMQVSGEENPYTGRITLKHGQTATFNSLPVGAEVTVVEDDYSDYFTTTYEPLGETIVQEGDAGAIHFKVTNSALHNLTLSKTVSGNMGNREKPFKFAITLTNADATGVNGTYEFTGTAVSPANGKITFENGKAEVQLKHGQEITITGLPTGTNYTIEETNSEGYTVSINDVTLGTDADKKTEEETLNTDASVNFVNTLNMSVPTGVGLEIDWVVPVVAMGCAGLVWMLYRRRRRGL